jgi:glycine/D-amino acid oxidase-like deaminating enzyme
MAARQSVLVVGSGVFGVTSALALARRGHDVTLMDQGPIPYPKAASTDISKIIRMDYGSDELYTSMMEEAFTVWDRWNREWEEPLYHQDGFLLLTLDEMTPGGLEYESFHLQRKRGYQPERISSDILKSKYPAWNAEKYSDGYFNPRAGWAESGRVVQHLAEDAVAAGVQIRQNLSVVGLCDESDRVSGVITSDGVRYPADLVVLATGAWSPLLSPRLAEMIVYIAQPVFHFRPKSPDVFRARQFPVWAADMAKTGWYGFPANRDGIVKIANHGPGRKAHPDDERTTTTDEELRFRNFLKESLPGLADAPIAASRTCFYADSWDGNFYIDHDPELPGLVYATGGSGHGFKFAPVLGNIVADVVEGKPNPYASRFAWRRPEAGVPKEQARYQGET